MVAVAIAIGWAIAGFAEQGAGTLGRSVPFLLLAATIAAVALREGLGHQVSLLSPLGIGSLAYFIMFAAVPLADIRFGHPLIHHEAWWKASWLVLFGYVALYTGFRGALLMLPPTPRRQRTEWSSQRSGLIACVLLAIALLGLFVEFSSIGLTTYIAKFARRHEFIENSVPLLIRITMATPALLLLVGTWISRPTLKRALFIVFVVLPPVILASGFLGQRWRILTLLVAIAAVVHHRIRRLPLPILLLLLGGLAYAFVAFAHERNYVGTSRTSPSVEGTNFYYNYLRKHEVGQFRDFVITLEGVPKRLEFQRGRTFLALIPQAPFPTASSLFTATFFPELWDRGTSIPTPLPGEFYLNFGVSGIFIGLAFFGFLIGLMESFYRRNRDRIGALLMYGYSIVPAAGIIRGDSTTFLGYFLLGLVPLAISLRFVERTVDLGTGEDRATEG